jgi:putative endopeptidase
MITILGAFARGNIYSPDMSDEEMYAKIGYVIGHEISHAFDRTGSQYDADGNLNSWWTEEETAAFRKKDEKLAAYYNAIHPWAGQDLHGTILTGEACADMGGIKVMLKLAEKKEGFDYDRFFRAYAEMWQQKATLPYIYSLIEDTHPLCYLRINTVLQQYDEFLDYYGIREGDGMYLSEKDRVNIW